MVRVRKLALAIAAASALSPGLAQALGLGDVTLKSALNQPLVAEIELLEVRGLAPNELLPSLASPDAFTKAGVNRQYFLTDLTFTPVLNPNGKSFIRVTSSKPVREPYLNFLVHVLWPSGRLLREYTLLLDPPLYAAQSRLAAPAPLPRSAALAQASRAEPRQSTAALLPVAGAGSLRDAQAYQTTARDTLGEIAQRMNTGGTLEQTMLAILDLNPQAFIDGNINLLMNAQRLQLPDAQQVNSRTPRQALAQVAEQHKAWREGRRVLAAQPRQPDASTRSGVVTARAQVEGQDRLELLSDEASPAGADIAADNAQDALDAKAGDQPTLNGQLAVIKENLDSTRRENDELNERMGDIQRQLNTLQQLVALKDDQLATLQAERAAQGRPASDAVPSASLLSREPGIALAAYPALPVAQSVASDSSDSSAATVAAVPPAPAEWTTLAPVHAAGMPAASVPEQPFARTQIDELTGNDQSRGTPLISNTVLLGTVGGGVLLLLLVALWLLARRNALKEAELQKSLKGDDDIEFDSDITSGSYLAPFNSPPAPPPDEALFSAPSSDALGQADIYIAYGRFNQAAELLRSAINAEPQRNELRLKLMEVYAELADREGFASQEAALSEVSSAQPVLQLLKANYPAMASLAVVGMAGATAVVATSTAAAAEQDRSSLNQPALDESTTQAPASVLAPEPAPAPAEADDAFDFNLDELDFDLDDDLQLAAAPASAPQDAGDPAELDFDLDDDLQLAAVPASVPQDSGDLAELDFAEASVATDELDNFDFEELTLDEPSAQAPSDTDEAFNFDLDAPDVDLDLEHTDERPADSLADDLEEFSLDLDLDLDRPADAADVEPDDFFLNLDEQAAVAPSLEAIHMGADLPLATLDLDEFELPADVEVPLLDVPLLDDELALPAHEQVAVPFDAPTSELDASSASLDLPTDQVMLDSATRAAGLEDEDEEVEAAEDVADDEAFDFLSGTDENATKLDLARAYIDMDDTDGARDILKEVLSEGTAGQQDEARELLVGLA